MKPTADTAAAADTALGTAASPTAERASAQASTARHHTIQAEPQEQEAQPRAASTRSVPAATTEPVVGAGSVGVSRLRRIHAYRLFWWLALAIFLSDQATKVWIAITLPYGTYGEPDAITVVQGFFYLVHVGNTGAAWSMLSGQSFFLATLGLGTLAAIYGWRHSLGLRQRWLQVSFGLLCGGISGNLLDRLLHGHVVDFLDFHFGTYIYPTFNIADSAIVVGVIIYFIQTLREPAQAAADKP